MEALLETALEGLPKRSGKVRDVYDLGDRLLLVATDRISAFDRVMPNGIPDKGRVLTGLSAFWFDYIAEGRRGVPHHMLSTDLDDAGLDLDPATRETLVGRSMIVRKCEPIPFECVVRGYISGSAWREYRESGTVCGEGVEPSLVESQQFLYPIFTPATKAESGHDINIPFAEMARVLDNPREPSRAEALKHNSIGYYNIGRAYAEERGLILADTKFEFGWCQEGGLILIDEILTPDSSRYWPADEYKPGGPQPSFDKQFVRDWLETTGWDKQSPPPRLPDDVVAKTRQKYIDAYERLTGQVFPWK